MARRIHTEVIEPILKGAPIASDRLEALAASYQDFFGVPPEHAWAQMLVDEVAEAKRAKLAHEAKIAVSARPGLVEKPNVWATTYRAEGGARAAMPTFAKGREIKTRPEWVYKRPDEWLLAIWGELEEGKPQILQYITFGRGEAIPYLDEKGWARIVMLRAIRRLAQADGGGLPEHILDDTLIIWLIDRMGFEGGGGSEHVTATTLIRWLISPDELADELERYARRVAERQSDTEASETEDKFFSLAKRVRSFG
jgi:hypothetical protein